jgi:hypothetical protein
VSSAPGLDQEFFTPDGEFENEWEFEGEFEAAPGGASAGLLMEHLGSMAAQAETEAEAEAFLGALVPLAARALPAIARATPSIIRGVSKVGRRLWSNPATRQMVRAVPQVVKRTAVDIARQHAAGRPLTASMATRSLARQTANVLGSPSRRRSALRRCRAMDRRWHVKHGQPPGPRGSLPCPACRKAR